MIPQRVSASIKERKTKDPKDNPTFDRTFTTVKVTGSGVGGRRYPGIESKEE